MTQVSDDRIRNHSAIEAVVRALEAGLIFVDGNGEIIGATADARRGMDGQLNDIVVPRDSQAVSCALSTLVVEVNGTERTVGVVQLKPPDEVSSQSRGELHRVVEAAVSDIMAEPSWFVRALTEKLKAWCQSNQTPTRSSDVEILTAREREILALICEGHTDAEMGKRLALSQNTVRNHVASLFRKIGVNRRSGAIIWARERGITVDEILLDRSRRRSRRQPH